MYREPTRDLVQIRNITGEHLNKPVRIEYNDAVIHGILVGNSSARSGAAEIFLLDGRKFTVLNSAEIEIYR